MANTWKAASNAGIALFLFAVGAATGYTASLAAEQSRYNWIRREVYSAAVVAGVAELRQEGTIQEFHWILPDGKTQKAWSIDLTP